MPSNHSQILLLPWWNRRVRNWKNINNIYGQNFEDWNQDRYYHCNGAIILFYHCKMDKMHLQSFGWNGPLESFWIKWTKWVIFWRLKALSMGPIAFERLFCVNIGYACNTHCTPTMIRDTMHKCNSLLHPLLHTIVDTLITDKVVVATSKQ
mgnify:CR=1 FL=1